MKTIKKTLSGLLAMIIMPTMLMVPVKAADEVQILSKTEATVFGNSSFTWNHIDHKESAEAADGTYTKFEGGGATITATKEFFVEEAGEFSFEVYAASYITNSALSQLQFNIDNDNVVTLENSNSTVTFAYETQIL